MVRKGHECGILEGYVGRIRDQKNRLASGWVTSPRASSGITAIRAKIWLMVVAVQSPPKALLFVDHHQAAGGALFKGFYSVRVNRFGTEELGSRERNR